MEHVYAVQTAEELPRSIVWTTRPIAAGLVSDIPLPAYTNDFRVMFDPELEDWRDIYLAQLDGLPDCEEVRRVRAHYERGLSQNHVLHILGHELAHHSALFFEEDYDNAPWFEEGMAEYIGRRYFLTAAEFDAQAEADRLLAALLEPRYGKYPLARFGAETYRRDFAGIFFDYHRAFLVIRRLVDERGGVHAVFRAYRQWHENPNGQTLAQWFQIE